MNTRTEEEIQEEKREEEAKPHINKFKHDAEVFLKPYAGHSSSLLRAPSFLSDVILALAGVKLKPRKSKMGNERKISLSSDDIKDLWITYYDLEPTDRDKLYTYLKQNNLVREADQQKANASLENYKNRNDIFENEYVGKKWDWAPKRWYKVKDSFSLKPESLPTFCELLCHFISLLAKNNPDQLKRYQIQALKCDALDLLDELNNKLIYPLLNFMNQYTGNPLLGSSTQVITNANQQGIDKLTANQSLLQTLQDSLHMMMTVGIIRASKIFWAENGYDWNLATLNHIKTNREKLFKVYNEKSYIINEILHENNVFLSIDTLLARTDAAIISITAYLELTKTKTDIHRLGFFSGYTQEAMLLQEQRVQARKNRCTIGLE